MMLVLIARGLWFRNMDIPQWYCHYHSRGAIHIGRHCRSAESAVRQF